MFNEWSLPYDPDRWKTAAHCPSCRCAEILYSNLASPRRGKGGRPTKPILGKAARLLLLGFNDEKLCHELIPDYDRRRGKAACTEERRRLLDGVRKRIHGMVYHVEERLSEGHNLVTACSLVLSVYVDVFITQSPEGKEMTRKLREIFQEYAKTRELTE